MTNLFSAASAAANNGGANQLHKTAELTATAATVVERIFKVVSSNEELYAGEVLEAQRSHEAMDKLVTGIVDLQDVDVDFLSEVSEDDAEKMLRSQQSKRSRAKSKVMTIDNFKTMMNATVAELILRMVFNKSKVGAGHGSRTSDMGYSDEEIANFQQDQEALKREIRNVQSKKSIAKSKANFDESSDKWQQLLEAEELLKSLRVGGVSRATVVDNRINEIQELFVGLDITSLKAAEAKTLLEKIAEVLNGGTTEEVTEQ